MKNSLKSYFNRHLLLFLLVILIVIIFSFYFWLFSYDLGDLIYIIILCAFIIVIIVLVDFYYYHKEYRAIQHTIQSIVDTFNIIEADKMDPHYLLLINFLIKELITNQKYNNELIEDIKEYYSLWIHQIKVPISAIDFTLQNSNHPSTIPINNELIKINQYVEMALNYLKLESSNSDLYNAEISLDEIVKEIIQKFSSLFT